MICNRDQRVSHRHGDLTTPYLPRPLSDVGMVLEWEQPTGLLYTTGDVRYIRVWDTHKELKIQDVVTGAESCVTSIALDTRDRSLMVAGFGDGTVRLYDKRNPLSCR